MKNELLLLSRVRKLDATELCYTGLRVAAECTNRPDLKKQYLSLAVLLKNQCRQLKADGRTSEGKRRAPSGPTHH